MLVHIPIGGKIKSPLLKALLIQVMSLPSPPTLIDGGGERMASGKTSAFYVMINTMSQVRSQF